MNDEACCIPIESWLLGFLVLIEPSKGFKLYWLCC